MAAPVCSTNLSWSRQVRGSKGDLYNVEFGEKYDGTIGWSCTCPDYRLRRQAKGEICKHIRVASSWRCCWNAELDPTRTVPANGLCPLCRAKVVWVEALPDQFRSITGG